MRGFVLAGIALMAIPCASFAQVQRWNDRARVSWTDDAPTVSVYIDGSRTLGPRSLARVRVRVSDDAYVVVGRVNTAGRLTILFPQNRADRTFVRHDQDLLVRGKRVPLGYSFVTNEYNGTGYVFAIASYAPLELSRFKTGDFENFGSLTPFSQASRSVAFRPEAMIERFASWTLYDDGVPYDYDVDFYAINGPAYASPLSACSMGGSFLYGEPDPFTSGWGWYSSLDSYALDSPYGLFYSRGWGLNPYASLCRNYYNTFLGCLGFSAYSYFASCSPYHRPFIVSTGTPPVVAPIGDSGDSTVRVRPGLIGNLWRPDTVGRPVADDPRGGKPAEEPNRVRATPGADAWDHLYAIPERSLDNLKRSPLDERRKESGATTRTERGWVEPEMRGTRTSAGASTGAPQRVGSTRDEGSQRDPGADPPRRYVGGGGSGGSARSGGGDAPQREQPRSYSPPSREAPRGNDAPARTTGGSAASVRGESPSGGAPAARPSGGAAPQPTKGSTSTAGEPKKPPM